jgi:hypothetical protein
MKSIKLKGRYLGGLPEELTPYPNTDGTSGGVFHIYDQGIGVRIFRQGKMHGAVSWERMASIELSGGTAAKSKVGATIMFGVAGALGSAGTQDRTEVIVHLKDGNEAYYQVYGKSELALRAQLLPVMAQHGVRFLNGTPPTGTEMPASTTSGSPQMPTVGWHPVGGDSGLQAYWDGKQWSTHKRWDGKAWIDVVPPG